MYITNVFVVHFVHFANVAGYPLHKVNIFSYKFKLRVRVRLCVCACVNRMSNAMQKKSYTNQVFWFCFSKLNIKKTLKQDIFT